MKKLHSLILGLAILISILACGRESAEEKQRTFDEAVKKELSQMLRAGIVEVDSQFLKPLVASYDVERYGKRTEDEARREIIYNFLFERLLIEECFPSDADFNIDYFTFTLEDNREAKRLSITSAQVIFPDKMNPEVRDVLLQLSPSTVRHLDVNLRSHLTLRVEATYKNGKKEIADIPFNEIIGSTNLEDQVTDFLMRCLDNCDTKKICTLHVVLS